MNTAPVDSFSESHEDIVSGLRAFAELPALQDAARRAREVAQRTLRLMDEAVRDHHAQEEEELFPAVVRSARPGEERSRVQALVARLAGEHREIEAAWKRLRPDVARAAAGRNAALGQEQVDPLVVAYWRHVQTEEHRFLPLAQEILARDGNHMAALGIALHLRSAPVPVGYI